jgi:hypothetical protein
MRSFSNHFLHPIYIHSSLRLIGLRVADPSTPRWNSPSTYGLEWFHFTRKPANLSITIVLVY